MGMTMTEKIIAAHAGLEEVKPGQLVNAKVDVIMAHDITGPPAFKALKNNNLVDYIDPEKIVLVLDHIVPPKDIDSAMNCMTVRQFAEEKNIDHFYDIGQGGIAHNVLPEEGLVAPGDLAVGGDSHTCTYGALGCFATGMGHTDIAAAMALGEVWLRVPETLKFVYNGKIGKYVTGKDLILNTIGKITVNGANYKAMEFVGNAIKSLPMEQRFTMTNMVIEASGKNGVMAVDDVTRKYVKGRVDREYNVYQSDEDAKFEKTYEFDVSDVPPLVAKPYSPDNIASVEEVKGVKVDQVFIGSCTNGWLGDLRQAAEIMKGERIAKGIRLIVIPATMGIYRQALKEGIIDVFIDAGGVVAPSTCGPCPGLHQGVMGPNEVGVFTTNRNFRGRTGHPEAKIYLTNPYTAAATAITGEITDPRSI
ncbi:MAG: 3-isopropylmalate dehydratase large subunit [Thaumarchaeota archaeon]|nr:3-isopropylmalate dehydratase large subunit [Nitrososphaerota archaeon]